VALFSCYTVFVPKNITIKLADETALWARRKAAEENTSVSRLLSDMLEREMRLSDAYWRAFEHWKSHRPLAAAGAANRMSREQTHERDRLSKVSPARQGGDRRSKAGRARRPES
jgi:hypothetical protein